MVIRTSSWELLGEKLIVWCVQFNGYAARGGYGDSGSGYNPPSSSHSNTNLDNQLKTL